MSVVQKWEEFDDNYASLEKDLEVLVSSLPSVSLVEETEERLLERISFYQVACFLVYDRPDPRCFVCQQGRWVSMLNG